MQQIKCSIPNQEPIEWVLAEETGPTGGGRLADSVEEEEETDAGVVGARNGAAAGHESPGLAGSVELGGQQPGGFNPFLSLPTERNACDYKRGYVIRQGNFSFQQCCGSGFSNEFLEFLFRFWSLLILFKHIWNFFFKFNQKEESSKYLTFFHTYSTHS